MINKRAVLCALLLVTPAVTYPMKPNVPVVGFVAAALITSGFMTADIATTYYHRYNTTIPLDDPSVIESQIIEESLWTRYVHDVVSHPAMHGCRINDRIDCSNWSGRFSIEIIDGKKVILGQHSDIKSSHLRDFLTHLRKKTFGLTEIEKQQELAEISAMFNDREDTETDNQLPCFPSDEK